MAAGKDRAQNPRRLECVIMVQLQSDMPTLRDRQLALPPLATTPVPVLGPVPAHDKSRDTSMSPSELRIHCQWTVIFVNLADFTSFHSRSKLAVALSAAHTEPLRALPTRVGTKALSTAPLPLTYTSASPLSSQSVCRCAKKPREFLRRQFLARRTAQFLRCGNLGFADSYVRYPDLGLMCAVRYRRKFPQVLVLVRRLVSRVVSA